MSKNEASEFVMAFVSAAARAREGYLSLWREVASNFHVEPYWGTTNSSGEISPYRDGFSRRRTSDPIVLKDPETHKLVMTYASKLMLTLFGDPKGEYIRARPVGWEDAPHAAPTVTKLLRYAMRLPGHYRTMLESMIDLIQFGTSVIEVGYRFEEREMPVRTIDSNYGVETSKEDRAIVPVYDDPVIKPIDVLDFFPDPARYRIEEMCGAAKRFRMTGYEAERLADAGVFDRSAVKLAILQGTKEAGNRPAEEYGWENGIRPDPAWYSSDREYSAPGLTDIVGYEYWGYVPYKSRDGSMRRVVTVLGQELVRNDPYPYADPHLPFHALVINPVVGRFYGVAPAEVVKYDQSFADAMKILLAEAIIRQVHPPMIADIEGDADIAAIKAWKADSVILARGGPNAVGTMRYDANVANGFAMLTGLKASIQEASGALGAIQGMEGPDREAASVGVRRLAFALDRPELAASLIEKECLPGIGAAILARYQQFLGDTDDLKQRVGELPEPVWIGTIMGQFDIEFVGSRLAMSREQKLQAYDRLITMSSAIPAFAAIIPWQQLAQEIIGEVLELPEIAARIGNPQDVQRNLLLMSLLGAKGGGGSAPASTPAGLPTSQSAGAGAEE